VSDYSRENAKEQPFDPMLGSQLSSVEFVQDYVQLHFDGPSLIAITRPMVEVDGQGYSWGSSGYGDALCGRIARLLQKTYVVNGDTIHLMFDDGSSILISLKETELRGNSAEAAILQRGKDDVWVW